MGWCLPGCHNWSSWHIGYFVPDYLVPELLFIKTKSKMRFCKRCGKFEVVAFEDGNTIRDKE